MAVKKDIDAKNTEASQQIKKIAPTKGQQKALKAKGMANKYTCVHHGKELVEDNFYMVNKGSIFKGLDRLPVCKDCVRKIYLNYYHQNGKDVIQSVFLTCRKLDLKFDLTTCQSAMDRANGVGEDAFQWYIQMYNSLSQLTQPASFDDSDNVQAQGTFEDVVNKIQSSTKLDPDDKKNRAQIKKRLGYDPFADSGLNDFQLARSYTELIGWLDADEDLADDPFKMNIVLQLINTNLQIKQIDLFIGLLSGNISNFQENMAMLSTLNNTKSKLVDSATKIYKENKWLSSDGGTTKNKLTVMMKRYREMGFNADADYFDIVTAKSVKTIMDLSNKSISEQLDFGDAEAKELFMIQRKLIQEKDDEIARLFQKNKETARENQSYKQKYGELNDSE